MLNLINYSFKGLHRILSVLIFLVIWEVAPRVGLVDTVFLPPFSKVALAFWNLLITGELFKHIGISLSRAGVGFGLGLLFAIPLGLIIGWFRGFERFIDPLMQTFRQTSVLALFPVFMLLFGIGELSKVAVIFWGVQWAVLLTTIGGVKNIDPLFIKSARSMGISPLSLFIKVILPASMPSIFTGVRLSATNSILILVAAEMLGANSGLGYLIFFYEVNFLIPKMYAIIITMSMLGLIVNYSLLALERKTLKWKEELPAV
ncbi:MAG TPA: ABC transporter permease [Desulfosporosinus sp.]|nr:ABC transporter permease [Desulfosporosinus sp.]